MRNTFFGDTNFEHFGEGETEILPEMHKVKHHTQRWTIQKRRFRKEDTGESKDHSEKTLERVGDDMEDRSHGSICSKRSTQVGRQHNVRSPLHRARSAKTISKETISQKSCSAIFLQKNSWCILNTTLTLTISPSPPLTFWGSTPISTQSYSMFCAEPGQ